MCLADLEADLLQLLLDVLRLAADCLLLQQVCPRLVLRLHLRVKPILLSSCLILLVFLRLLQLVIEGHVVLEFSLVLGQQGVLHDIGESHSFLAVHYENALEEVLEL